MAVVVPRVKSKKARLLTETFALRDDEAMCGDCDWTWTHHGYVSRTAEGGRQAKAHAKFAAHQVTVRRVQFIRHTGIEDAPTVDK